MSETEASLGAKEGVPATSITIVNQYTQTIGDVVYEITVYRIERTVKTQMALDEYDAAFSGITWKNPEQAEFNRTVALVRLLYLTEGNRTSKVSDKSVSHTTFRSQMRESAKYIREELLFKRKMKTKKLDLSKLTATKPIPFTDLTLGKISTLSGVYIFRAFGEVLYVGSAKEFRERFGRYFAVLRSGAKPDQDGYEGELLLAGWQRIATEAFPDGMLTVQFIPCGEHREVEAVLIHELEPPFNRKSERAGIFGNAASWLKKHIGNAFGKDAA